MRKRVLFFVAALAGASAVAGGLVAGLDPFRSAEASSPPGSNRSGDVLDRLLSDSEPGAVVRKLEEGNFSVAGKMTAEAAAEVERAEALANTFPASLRCSGDAMRLNCTAVPDSDVIPALRRGEPIYARRLYGGIRREIIENQVPYFTADEFVCDGQITGGTMRCTSVAVRRPEIAPSQTSFVTYKLFDVTFDREGNPVGHEVFEQPTVAFAKPSG